MGHYKNIMSIKTMDDLKALFPDGKADNLNWCLFSMSGVHGGYESLDDLVEELNSDEDYEYPPRINMLVIRPRMVSIL